MCVCAQSLSSVWLFAALWTVAHQVPLSMGFFRQEYWSGLPFSFSRDSSWPKDWTCISCVSCIGRWILYHCATWKAPLPYLILAKRSRNEKSIWKCKCWHVTTSSWYNRWQQNSIFRDFLDNYSGLRIYPKEITG